MNKRAKVLIVEDEALTALMLCNELKKVGYETFNNASSADIAIRLAEEKSPDIIFMDICLAGKKDGIEAAETILSKNEIPIVFMTGYSSKEFRDRAMKLKPTAYLEKPVDIDEMILLIEKEIKEPEQ